MVVADSVASDGHPAFHTALSATSTLQCGLGKAFEGSAGLCFSSSKVLRRQDRTFEEEAGAGRARGQEQGPDSKRRQEVTLKKLFAQAVNIL